jgi:tryptophan-rich sensory protein
MKLRVIFNILAFLVMIFVNFLANILPIAGRTTGEISDAFPVLFTPAGYVFGIWGIIYIGLGAFVIFQALPSQHNNMRLESVGFLFVVNALLNAAWIFLWHNLLIPLSMLVMIGILVTLALIYQRLAPGRASLSIAEMWFARVPFSIYFGWISVATIANAAVMLYDLGWRGQPLSQEFWAGLVIAVAALIGVYMILKRREVAFALVLVWALIGIFVGQFQIQAVPFIALAAVFLISIVLVYDRARRQVIV